MQGSYQELSQKKIKSFISPRSLLVYAEMIGTYKEYLQILQYVITAEVELHDGKDVNIFIKLLGNN